MGKQKDPPLTKEEKLERKRTKKLLAKQKKVEKICQVKRDQLSRELEYCRLNRKIHEKGWTRNLFDFKMKDLHITYQYHVHHSERILDTKDLQISILLDELDVAEEQYIFNLQNYILNFDKIIDALDQSLNQLKDEYDADLQQLKELSEAERNYQNNLDSEREYNLKLVQFGLENVQKEKSNEVKLKYLFRLKEEESTSMAEIKFTQVALERRFESLWRDYKETINDYRRENNDTKKKYEVLHNQDSFMRKWIKNQTRQLFKVYDNIYQLKFSQSQEKDSIDLQLNAKIEEHQFFCNGFHTLKEQLKSDLIKDDKQSKNVVKYCNISAKKLEMLMNEGEKILKLNAICRKFETAEELVMPYPEYSPPDSTMYHLKAEVSYEPLKIHKEKKIMDLFMQRCCQSDALRNALYEEMDFYLHRNMLLKRKLFRHCKSPKYSCTNVKKYSKFICVKNYSDINLKK